MDIIQLILSANGPDKKTSFSSKLVEEAERLVKKSNEKTVKDLIARGIDPISVFNDEEVDRIRKLRELESAGDLGHMTWGSWSLLPNIIKVKIDELVQPLKLDGGIYFDVERLKTCLQIFELTLGKFSKSGVFGYGIICKDYTAVTFSTARSFDKLLLEKQVVREKFVGRVNFLFPGDLNVRKKADNNSTK